MLWNTFKMPNLVSVCKVHFIASLSILVTGISDEKYSNLHGQQLLHLCFALIVFSNVLDVHISAGTTNNNNFQ